MQTKSSNYNGFKQNTINGIYIAYFKHKAIYLIEKNNTTVFATSEKCLDGDYYFCKDKQEELLLRSLVVLK